MRVVNVSDIPQTIYKNTVTTECEIVLDSSVVSFQDQSCDEMDDQTVNKIDPLKVPQEHASVPDHIKVVLDSCRNNLIEVELTKCAIFCVNIKVCLQPLKTIWEKLIVFYTR